MKAIYNRCSMAMLTVALAHHFVLVTPSQAALTVLPGSDLFETVPGTTFMGIPFEGVPLTTTLGNTDTIVRRLGTATVASEPGTTTIPIEMIALQLKSVSPVVIPTIDPLPDFYYVTLDPGTPSVGTMDMTFSDVPGHKDPPNFPDGGGTFDSSIDVNFHLRKSTLTGPIVLTDTLELKSSGSLWDHIPAPGDVLFKPAAPGPLGVINFELNSSSSHNDFFAGLTIEEHPAGSETKHIARPATHEFIEPAPDLPPIGGGYLSATDVHSIYSGADLEIVLMDPKHRPVASQINRVEPFPGGETDVFFSQLEATADVQIEGLPPISGAVVTATGQSTVNVFGKEGSNQTGTFETEFVQLDLVGTVEHPDIPGGQLPIQIQSTGGVGQTSVTALLNSPDFAVDSFFDINTTVTIPNPLDPSGPPLQAQSQQPARVHLETLGTDVNNDGKTDNTDLGVGFGNFTGPSDPLVNPQGKFHKEGDVEGGDQDVDNSDLGRSFGNFGQGIEVTVLGDFSAVGSAGNVVDSSSRADLIYDPSDGNVKLDASEAAGSVVTNFVLKNSAGGSDFTAPGTATFPFVSLFTTDTLTEISQTDGTAIGFSGIHDLGNIFPTGLTSTTLQSFLTQASYVGALGTGNPVLDLVIIPEPSAAVLLVICLLGLSVGRQRR